MKECAARQCVRHKVPRGRVRSGSDEESAAQRPSAQTRARNMRSETRMRVQAWRAKSAGEAEAQQRQQIEMI